VASGSSKSDALNSSIHAGHGGIAAGRDVNITGLDETEVGRAIAKANVPMEQALAALIAQISRDKGVPIEPLRAILLKLGEAGVADHEIAARLDESADELIELRTQLVLLRGDNTELASIRDDALLLIDRGALDAARDLLCTGRLVARSLRVEAARTEAELLSSEGRIDHLQLDYVNAAARYGDAADLTANFDRRTAWDFLIRQANELFNQGHEFGDNDAFRRAIVILEQSFAFIDRSASALDWATTKSRLGTTLSALGAREPDTIHLKEAIAAFREALAERTRERTPLDWAVTQNNLGNALTQLGEREASSAHLEEAVAAYREALTERTRERLPLDWAATQSNLGNALKVLAERETGTNRLEEAVAAYRSSLIERTRERAPLEWAGTQCNLGNVLVALGHRERGTTRLEEAVVAFRAALTEQTRKRVPLQWALTENNLGNALKELGERETGITGADHLKEAVAAYQAALSERTRERVPLDWAQTQYNLGNVLRRLGEREAGNTHLDNAILAYRASSPSELENACRLIGQGRTLLSATRWRPLANAKLELGIWTTPLRNLKRHLRN